MLKSYNQAAIVLLAVLTLVGIGAVIVVALPIVSSENTLSKMSFHLSGHIIEPLVFALLFTVTALLALKLNKGWAALCGLPFLALAVLPFLQPDMDLSSIEKLEVNFASQAEQIAGLVAVQSADHASFTTRDVELSTALSVINIRDILVLDCRSSRSCSCPSGWKKIQAFGFTEDYGNLTIGTRGNHFLYLCKIEN